MRFNPDEYITVHERIEKFYAKFPNGRIITSVFEHNEETGFCLMRAEVYREPDDALPAATGHAYELKSAGHVQAGSYVEVCETSSVGRALALLGFEVKRGVASREEVVRGAQKAQSWPQAPRAPVPDKMLDREIMAALEVLGYTEDQLNKSVAKDYGHRGDWTELSADKKREVLARLNSLANEKVTQK